MAAQTIVLDLGTATTKAGLVGESLPSVVFPTLVGQPLKKTGLLKKAAAAAASDALPAHLVGHDAVHNVARVALSHPVKHGAVVTWPMIEQILNHCFAELGVEPDATGVVITEPPFNPRKCTETLAQTLFEAFSVPEVAVVPSGMCALYASGRTTGLVVDSGAGVTHVTPVFDSFVLANGMNRLNFGGADVSQHLRALLFERGHNFTTPHDLLVVDQMKERHGFVSADYERDILPATDEAPFLQPFALPDGQAIRVGKERFRAPEIIFSPHITHSERPSLPEFVTAAVKACEIDVRRALLSNVVLCGGNTLFGGFAKRLEEEVLKSFPGLFGSVNVLDAPDRMFNTWAGASVVASLPSFAQSVVTRDVYDEHGPAIVRNYRRAGGDADADDGPPPE